MKLRNLSKNSIVRAGKNNLVVSIWDEDNERFFVVNDVPRITRKQFNELYHASFGGETLHDHYGMDLLAYNLTGDYSSDDRFEWSEKDAAGVDGKVGDQSFTSIKWKDLPAKATKEYTRYLDDFD